ncbi:response regulator [Methanobacterium sp. ACI-7]|uniref:response regulator n=1 Tax=unclassified Methanobacterium TaxID=2627676 RepID=UPI0039C1C92C
MVDILIVEDEGLTALELQNILKVEGYGVPFIASSGEEAIKKVIQIEPDLILMDIMLDGTITGVKAAEEIKKVLDIPIIYITAYGDKETLQNAKITEPHAYILKPFEGKEIIYAIELGLQRHEMEMKLKKSLSKKDYILEKINDQIQNNQSHLSNLIKQGLSENDNASERFNQSLDNIHKENSLMSPDFALVDFSMYIETMIEDLVESKNLNNNLVNINLNMDNLMLDLNTALLCGLIIEKIINIFVKMNPDINLDVDIDFYIDKSNFILNLNGNNDIKSLNSNSEFKMVNSFVKQLKGSIVDENNSSQIKIIFER